MPENSEKIQKIIKNFYEIEGTIPTGFLLNQGKGANSLGKARLSALLRKEDIHIAQLREIKTLEELLNKTSEKNVVSSGNKIFNSSLTQQNLVGIDIEQISKFPPVSDYWTDPFYHDNFTDAEIAYCIQKDYQPEHFAGKWCVKEALVKCFPELSNVRFSNIEVSINNDNRLVAFKEIDGQKFPIPAALSISHTQEHAIGIAIFQNQSVVIEKIISQPELKLQDNSLKKWKQLTLFAASLSFILCIYLLILHL